MDNLINCQYCGKPRPKTVGTCPYCKPTASQIIKNGLSNAVESYRTEAKTAKNNKEQKEYILDTSTKKCIKCAMDVPAKAEICPYCRKRIMTAPMSMGCAIFIALSVIVIMIAGIFGASDDNSRGSANKFDAIEASKTSVSLQLKAPASAKFPDPDKFIITDNGSSWTVVSYVDAQNSFGAMLRNYFNCEISKTSLTGLCVIEK